MVPTRRHLLKLFAAPAILPGLAFATTTARPGRRFVLIILRGAMDGLAAVPPLADPDYAALRTTEQVNLAIGTPAAPQGAMQLDARFWLHPALAPLYKLFGRQEMLVVHAVASPYRERSHFDAQNVIETGLAVPGAGNDGWLNRALGVLGGTGISGIAFTPEMPLVLKGHAPVANWQPSRDPADISAAVRRMYGPAPALAAAYAQGLAAAQVVARANQGGSQDRSFIALAGIAGKTLAAADGPNVAVLEVGGWDTHVGQGATKGRLAAVLAKLATAVEALQQNLGPAWNSTVIAAITEFGRTARPNGTGGTDHGTASAALLFGGALAGGRVIADWPGLSPGALYENRDLAPTMELRSVLKGVLGDHMGATSAALEHAVFPGSAHAKPLAGLVRL